MAGTIRQITGGEFDAEVLRAGETVLVDFYATWCGPCHWLAPRLERFAARHAPAVRVVKVDVDADAALAESYGVQKIPTVISFRHGREVARAINPQSDAALEALLPQEAAAPRGS
jgi:thioredoxin